LADLPATTPFLVTSSIVIGDGTAVGSQVIQAVGLMVHFTISIFYGMAFGLITPWLRTNGTVAVAGVAFGGLIYAVDFQVIARIWFPVFTRQDQPVALLVHLIYGLVVAAAFYSSDVRCGEPVLSVGRPARKVADPQASTRTCRRLGRSVGRS
jgi:hypothetical protein